jgi:hypothetical protein
MPLQPYPEPLKTEGFMNIFEQDSRYCNNIFAFSSFNARKDNFDGGVAAVL